MRPELEGECERCKLQDELRLFDGERICYACALAEGKVQDMKGGTA